MGVCYIIVRESVSTMVVGPFATQDDAEIWQRMDIEEKGHVDYQVYEVTDPSDDSIRLGANITSEE